MTTGRHVVRDLFCVSCGSMIGWKYEVAFEHQERYKEGKYILERLALVDLEAAAAVGLGQLSANLNDAVADAVGGLTDFSVLEGPGRPFRTSIGADATPSRADISTRPLLGLARIENLDICKCIPGLLCLCWKFIDLFHSFSNSFEVDGLQRSFSSEEGTLAM